MVSEAAFRIETIAEGNIPAHDEGKIKIIDNVEVEQNSKFKADPLVEKATLEIEAKTRHEEHAKAER